jgi:hypothetical protein
MRIDEFFHDARFALRGLSRAPGFARAVVLVACWAPSRRILRIDPAAALRHD